MTRAAQLSAFADQDPRNPVLLCELLDELLLIDDLPAVRSRLAVVSVEVSGRPEVRFREARAALQSGDFGTAVQILEDLATGIASPPAGIVHDLAYAKLLLGEAGQALRTLDDFHPADADEATFALLRARVLHHMRRHREAIEVLAVVRAGPYRAQASGLRAMLWLDEGDRGQARAEAAYALQLDPDQHEAAVVQGTLALWDRRVDESTPIFERVLARYPSSGRALLGLGQDRMLRGEIPAGRALVQRAVVEMPAHLGTLHALAWCQLLEGDLAGAKQSFDKALAVDRTFGETHGGLALVHALRGERSKAQASIKRAMRLEPRGRSARYAASVLALDEGHVEEAHREIDQLLAMSPDIGVPVPADFIFRLRELIRPRG